MRLRQIRPQRQRLLITTDGRSRLSLAQPAVAQIIVSFGVVGPQRQRLLVSRNRLIKATLLL